MFWAIVTLITAAGCLIAAGAEVGGKDGPSEIGFVRFWVWLWAAVVLAVMSIRDFLA